MPDLATALRPVLPDGVTLGQAAAALPLVPGEAIGSAAPARLEEFALGRTAARAALAALGQGPVAIPAGTDRAPVWPEGTTGSITHCAGACLAVTGHSRQWAGLGLDAEPLRPLEPDLWPALLAEGEDLRDGMQALAHFVAKEAAYKAQYPLSRQLFDFATLRLTWAGDRFAAAFTHPVAPFAKGAVLSGQVVRTARHLAALVAIAA
jgi:4'-phosphopantetheinyl transferase EntD